MPHDCHSALAVTGAVAIATACVTSGTIAAEMVGPLAPPVPITLAHPSGQLVVRPEPGPVARVLRTARRIFEGHVFARRSQVPHSVLAA
jgi:2-methylaconitate cis-trans-isomerase PrpF